MCKNEYPATSSEHCTAYALNCALVENDTDKINTHFYQRLAQLWIVLKICVI